MFIRSCSSLVARKASLYFILVRRTAWGPPGRCRWPDSIRPVNAGPGEEPASRNGHHPETIGLSIPVPGLRQGWLRSVSFHGDRDPAARAGCQPDEEGRKANRDRLLLG